MGFGGRGGCNQFGSDRSDRKRDKDIGRNQTNHRTVSEYTVTPRGFKTIAENGYDTVNDSRFCAKCGNETSHCIYCGDEFDDLSNGKSSCCTII